MSSPYDVLGDPNEYEEWLALQQPPEPAVEIKRDNVAQQIQELPEDILQVVSELDPQRAFVILSAYQQLQLRRYAQLYQVLLTISRTPSWLTSVAYLQPGCKSSRIHVRVQRKQPSLMWQVSRSVSTSNGTQLQTLHVARLCTMPEYGL